MMDLFLSRLSSLAVAQRNRRIVIYDPQDLSRQSRHDGDDPADINLSVNVLGFIVFDAKTIL